MFFIFIFQKRTSKVLLYRIGIRKSFWTATYFLSSIYQEFKNENLISNIFHNKI